MAIHNKETDLFPNNETESHVIERYENQLFRQMLTTAMRGGAHMPTIMEQYFRDGDDGTVVWWVTSAAPVRPSTSFLQDSVYFADTSGQAITIADPWGGREPQRIDAHAARGGESEIRFRVELQLDSQIVTYLDQFVRNSPRLSSAHRALMNRLLRFAVKRKIGYNPAFYFMEALREADPNRIEHARATARSILALHTMDPDYFLATGSIRPSAEGQRIYQREFGGLSFAATEARYADGFVSIAGQTDVLVSGVGQLRYATLLGIAAIHRERPGIRWNDIRMKCMAFDDLLGEVGAEMPLERLVAVLYFSGLIDDFIPIQRGARPQKVLARVRAAVWDLQFLHMPARSLIQHPDPDDGVIVAYPCTMDSTLGRLAGNFTFELVASWRGRKEPIPMYGFRDSTLQKAFAVRGIKRPWPHRVRLTETDLADIIKEREARMLAHCE